MGKLSLKDIKKSIIDILKNFDVKIYADEVKEGFNTPCFFVNVEKFENSLENSNFTKRYLDIYIRYIHENISDIHKLEIIEALEELFLSTIKVKDRIFTIHNKSFIKNKNDYVELNFGIEYYEFLEDEEEMNSEKMNNFELDL